MTINEIHLFCNAVIILNCLFQNNPNAMEVNMVANSVIVNVKPEHIEDFIKATVKNHENSIKEHGNMRFDVLQSIEDPSMFMLYEAYDSTESAAAHKKTSHYAVWRDKVAEWMAQPRKGISYKSIKP